MGKPSPLWLHETPRDPSQATRELGEAGSLCLRRETHCGTLGLSQHLTDYC